MTFDNDERSISGSRPIDLFTIVTPLSTFNLTSHIQDVEVGDVSYTAIPMSRGPLQVAQDLTGREVIVYLPITHPLIQRYASTGIPEREVVVTIYRLQSTSGEVEQIGQGFGTGISIDGHVAMMRVPSITDDAFKVHLPMVKAGLMCPHLLYDARCQISRSDFEVIAFIVTIVGTTVVVSSMAGEPSGFASPAGEILHIGTGERRQVVSQIGTTLTLTVPFIGVVPGDTVLIFASCDHSITDCHNKFNNVVNFGGMPALQSSLNPYAQNSLGTVVQS